MRFLLLFSALLMGASALAQVPCLDPLACNFNTMEECVYVDAEGQPCVVQGCTNALACNYDAEADADDGSCEFTSCLGCVDAAACNFDPTALYSDGSCLFTVDCNGVCGGTWVQDTCGFCYDPAIGTDGLDSLVVLEWTEAPETVMVPLGVTRAKFIVSGAQGGNGGGRGAILETDTVTLIPGSELTAFVGGQGPVIQTTGAGGGGSALRWVNAAGDTLYVIAGGGGGRDSQGSFYQGMHASLTENGNPGEQGWGGGRTAPTEQYDLLGWISGGGGGGFVSASKATTTAPTPKAQPAASASAAGAAANRAATAVAAVAAIPAVAVAATRTAAAAAPAPMCPSCSQRRTTPATAPLRSPSSSTPCPSASSAARIRWRATSTLPPPARTVRATTASAGPVRIGTRRSDSA